MAEPIRVGIVGGGWPGGQHARGYLDAGGGFRVTAVADLIPERRKKIMSEFGAAREYASAEEIVADPEIDAVSICLPNHLHAPITLLALKAKKHVMLEQPPALNAKEARKIDAAARKAGKVLMYAFQRRFSPNAQAARQAVEKGYVGDVYHARTVWTRTRGVPVGTGWYAHKEQAGGGAMMDVGIHMLDVAWYLLGQPKPESAYGVTHHRFGSDNPAIQYHVDDAAFAILRFEGGKSIELAASWAINQPQHQNGTACRLYGDKAAIELYTKEGAVLYRNFGRKGECKEHPLKGPKVVNYAALMRHFKECIQGRATPIIGGAQGIALMEMVDGIYESAASGKSVKL